MQNSVNLNESLQAKYPHLEISVLPLSQVKKDNEYFRIDSEPFKKSNLLFNNDIKYIKLSQVATINPLKTELQNYDENLEVTFLSMQNLGNGFINEREKGKIKDFKSGYTYFAENDILVAKITPCMEHGKCAIATNLTNKIGFGSTEFNVFRVKDFRFIQEFIFCFLNRESIRKIAADNMVGTSGRQRVPKAFYENLLIPILPKAFQLEIENLVQNSHKALEDSKAFYKEAENLLYEALGLNPTNPLSPSLRASVASVAIHKNNVDCHDLSSSNLAKTTPFLAKYPHLNISIRPLSQSYAKSGRLDSEYYQEKYDKIECKIKAYKGGYCRLQDIVLNYSGGFGFSSDDYLENGDLALIRINNIKNADLDMSNAVYLAANAKDLSLKDKVKKGDILISMSGSIGLSCLIRDDIEAMVNQRILKISIKDFDGNVLVLLLNSIFCKLQFERIGTGGVQTNVSSGDILNILIPKIDTPTQENIAKKITQSFALRQESKSLLNAAKAKVEGAIEKGDKNE